MGQNKIRKMVADLRFPDQLERWGALRYLTLVQNGPEWSYGVSWAAWEGLWRSKMVVGSSRRGLWRSSEGATMVSGGPERGSLEVFRGCMGSPGTVLRALVKVMCAPRRFMGCPNSKFSHFCNPYGVICTFSRAQLGTDLESEFWPKPTWDQLKGELGGP